MVIRLLVLGAVLALFAAFAGYRRAAVGMLVALALAAVGLWVYTGYQADALGSLFKPGDVQVRELALSRADYRPNLFTLTGMLRNQSDDVSLDGVALQLQLEACDGTGKCRDLPARREFIEVKLDPGQNTRFVEKLYFDKHNTPRGTARVTGHRIVSLQGHKPLW